MIKIDLQPGNVVFGPGGVAKYTIVRPLGNGAFGMVYEVEGAKGERYALKTISTAWLNQTSLNALINEGQLAVGIEHPNVIRVVYFHDGQEHPEFPPYMLMDLADGGTLQDLLNQRRKIKQFFTNNELRSMMLELAYGMRAVNEKLVHRDVKPDNILIHKDQLKVADFGLSKVISAATRTQTFKGIQHVMYAAPEAWRQEKNTIAMDMYSMGIIYYELATLMHPYFVEPTGDFVEAWKNAHLTDIPADPRKYNPDLDLRLSQVILRMISKRSTDRYDSWDEVISRLESTVNTSESQQDVSRLVERALGTQRREEAIRLKVASEAQQRKEHERIVWYAFNNDILRDAEQTVERFNAESEFVKLEIRTERTLAFKIHVKGRPTKSLLVQVEVVYDSSKLDGQTIRAWGYAKAPSGHGFNLILVASEHDDLYGSWRTLHVEHSPIVRTYDQRPSPFPFEINELPKEIPLLNAVHIYQTKKGQFTSDLFMPLIEELLYAKDT